MSGKKKRAVNDEIHVKRKKCKKADAIGKFMNQSLEAEDSTFEMAELLNAETIREGMLLLGCITGIKPTFLEMSLPGFLSGRVPLNNISSPFTKSLRDFATNSGMDEPLLSSLVKVGMTFPCRVIQISRDSSKIKSSIILSINPEDVNADLKPSLLYPKMVLYVSVCSIEDHGCIVDVGNKNIQSFLPKKYYQDYREEFKIGEVIPALIRQISSDKTSAKIQLSPLNFRKQFPVISVEGVKLNSILPGANIIGNVIEIKHPFIYVKYLCFDACASVLSLGPAYTAIKVGQEVYGTVLYVHPITHMIYLILNLKLSSELLESKYFGLSKYTCVNDLKYICSYKKFPYYVINKDTLGFFHPKDLPQKAPFLSADQTVYKACVLRCHYMDNLVQLSAKKSLLEKEIFFFEYVKIGDIYDAVVLKHINEGMFVRICPGLSGFVRQIHMSDVLVTRPEILHPKGSKVKCRVLSTDGNDKLNLTCKESLLKLNIQYILSSYDNLQIGQVYKGVIAQKTDEYILVLFFNDVKGIVSSKHVPKMSIYFVGQTVSCEILSCDSLKKKLKLLLEVEKRLPFEHFFGHEFPEESVCKEDNDLCTSKENVVHQKVSNNSIDLGNSILKIGNISSDESLLEPITEESNSGSQINAMIESIKGNQLNIMINKTKGRVYITELGCMSEGTYPLKEFSVGQKIQVYVIGEFVKQKKNFLEISHKNYIFFKECSISFPSYSLSQDFSTGKSLIGFIKEVHDVSVVLSLTPTKIGVLDFLHFSDSLKVIKSLQRHLKIGLSVKVSVLENNGPTITLTRIENILLQPGRNVIGLVQLCSSEHGLVLKLPNGYQGSVAVTDLTDVYVEVPILLQKYCKFKFLLCHVLEVNHQTKYCLLSLRKSRLYGKVNTHSSKFCPEITEDNIKEGNIIKGFVKSASNSDIRIILGRNLMGKIRLHTCSSDDCRLCETSKGIIHKYPVGSIAEVIIRKLFEDGRLCILDLTDSGEQMENKENVEDIFSTELFEMSE